MPRSVHHVSVVTAEAAHLIAVLENILGLTAGPTVRVDGAAVACILGWETVPTTIPTTILGDGAGGMVEIIEVPEVQPSTDVGSQPCSGVFQLAFNVRDVEATLAAFVEAGAQDVRGPHDVVAYGASVRVGSAVVADIRLQFATSPS